MRPRSACPVLGAMFLGVVAGFGFWSCEGGGQQDLPPPLKVATEVVQPTTKVLSRRFSGYANPYDARGVGFLVAGRVNGLYVDKGDRVRPGQLLASLDEADCPAARGRSVPPGRPKPRRR